MNVGRLLSRLNLFAKRCNKAAGQPLKRKGSLMLDRVERTCRYGHGALENQCAVSQGKEVHAYMLSDVKLGLWTMSAHAEGPILSATPGDDGGYIVGVYKCNTCGYLELAELSNQEVADAITRD